MVRSGRWETAGRILSLSRRNAELSASGTLLVESLVVQA
jgi:hypothetical protein